MRLPLIHAAVLTFVFASGCTPAVGLKHPTSLTPQQVTRLRTVDACRLASPHKATPKARVTTVERTVGHTSNWLEFGRATVRLSSGPQLLKLREILRRFYRAVPTTMLTSPLVMEVDFIRRIGTPKTTAKSQGSPAKLRPLGWLTVRSDHNIIVRVGGATFRLAYHPCVGELLFGSPPPARERSTMSEKLHRIL
jgi:hypothetical protein